MSKFKLCVFDWNGTLPDDFNYMYECAPERIFKHFGLPCQNRETYRNEVTADFMVFYHGHGIPKEVTAEELNAIMLVGFKEKNKQPELFSDAVETILGVRERGLETALVSGLGQSMLEEGVQRAGLAPYFSRVVGGAKNKVEVFGRLMKELGFSGAETAVIGDTVDDATAASQVGAVPFICPRGWHSLERIASSRKVVPSLIIIPTLKDLLRHLDGSDK